jgi:hypothetical protein
LQKIKILLKNRRKTIQMVQEKPCPIKPGEFLEIIKMKGG